MDGGALRHEQPGQTKNSPPLIRDRNRRVNIEMIVGAVVVGVVVLVLWRMGLLH
jgi:hypothetical protein